MYGAVRRRTLTYGNVVGLIEHADFYGSVHTHTLRHRRSPATYGTAVNYGRLSSV